MRRWLRSMLILVCVAALCAAMTGCGTGADTAPDPDAIELTQEEQQEWFDSAEQFILSMDEAVRTGQSILTEDDPVYGPAFESWENALPDIGEVVSVEGASTEFTRKEGTVRMTAHGTSHDAEVVIKMAMGDSYYEIESITTNVIYSFAELMQQAGLNTVLGMGTTFAVLILLSFIIALFGMLIRKAREKKDNAPVPARSQSEPATQEPVSEPAPAEDSFSDDAALIAVITAAVAAFESEQQAEVKQQEISIQPADGFVVRSIRKARRRF